MKNSVGKSIIIVLTVVAVVGGAIWLSTQKDLFENFLGQLINTTLYEEETESTTPLDEPPEPTAPSNLNLEFSLNEDGKSYSIIEVGDSTDGTIVLPATYEGLPITSIGDHSFKGCNNITSIKIPDGVTSIGKEAFSNCINLRDITMPDTVTSVGSGAFSNCVALTDITIPSSVTDIGEMAFYYSGITSVTFGENSQLTQIGANAFCCSSLESIIIPNSVTSIEMCAFSWCNRLKSITIPDGVTSIGDAAFSFCESLISITIPNGVTSIGSGAFSGCRDLTSITLSNAITSIGEGLFKGCGSLENIVIPNGVTSIDAFAFQDCFRLTNVKIPSGVTTICDGAFRGCDNLVQKENGIWYVDKWVVGCDSSVISAELRKNTVGIAAYAFYNCNVLTSITLPDSIMNMSEGAFSWCSSLTSIKLPEGMKSIGVWALANCTNMSNIIFEGTVSQWKSISIGSEWNFEVPATEVVCIDGTVALN